MKKELYRQNVREVSASIVQTEIQAIRSKNITKTAMRLYDGEHIGIAGALGDGDEGDLVTRAEKALARNLEYPFQPISGEKRSEEAPSNFNSDQEFIVEMGETLAQLKRNHPKFIFSNKLNLSNSTITLENDNGLDYTYQASVAELGLVIKERKSSNIIDAFLGYDGTQYNREDFLATASMVCDGFLEQVDIDDGEYPVLFFTSDHTYYSKLAESLNGLSYGSGTSLFSGKIGEKLFSDGVTVVQSRSDKDHMYMPFFDFEGAVNPEDRYTLIRNGVIESPYTNRNYAKKYDLPHTGAAAGAYDSVPDLGGPRFVIEESNKTAKELLDGKTGVLVYIASGGDFTSDGAFASPVQLGYLSDGERIIGRLPPLSISSHLYSMFGNDFLGVSKDVLFPNSHDKLAIMNMKVSKD